MVTNNMTIIIGGDAGQGVESSGAGFCKALARGGLHVYSVQDNRSRIRGGHNFYTIRAQADPIRSWTEPVHLLVALTKESVEIHASKLVKGGAVICDSSLKVEAEPLEQAGIKLINVPLAQLAKDSGGSKVMSNTAALGALAGLTQFPMKYIQSVIHDNFKKKGEKIIDINYKVAQAAYDYVVEHYGRSFEWNLQAVDVEPRMVINGNHAIALGALVGGCNYTSAYPMTPGTSVFEWLTTHADEYGIVSKQMEDEISAICAGIGAAHVGARVIVPTSGGGFSLMVEALGFAGMIEAPIVIVNAQRPGPSTGFATRTEQSDLLFIIYASQGEFPRIVLAPGTTKQCFEAGARAMNLSEKYQTPVIILTDAYLANSFRTVNKSDIDFSSITIDRGEFLTDADLDKLTEKYKRYLITESGISPRAIPGHPKAIFRTTSDEHNEIGEIVEEADIRNRMHTKRMKKLELARQEMRAPDLYGPAQADVTLVCWGSTISEAHEAIHMLNSEKKDAANLLHFVDIWPFPVEKATPFLENAKKRVAVEGNYTAQLAQLIRAETGINMDATILKFDGRPFSPEYIINKLKEVL
ncbi:2-oxoacid:acceptor oxidoreductase subunit alpha [candidate division KSB1 bacterium]|nr:2-oxoacid:acceptor oxidoreductase subunit alpha [candidate division KSB1 bacterium]